MQINSLHTAMSPQFGKKTATRAVSNNAPTETRQEVLTRVYGFFGSPAKITADGNIIIPKSVRGQKQHLEALVRIAETVDGRLIGSDGKPRKKKDAPMVHGATKALNKFLARQKNK